MSPPLAWHPDKQRLSPGPIGTSERGSRPWRGSSGAFPLFRSVFRERPGGDRVTALASDRIRLASWCRPFPVYEVLECCRGPGAKTDGDAAYLNFGSRRALCRSSHAVAKDPNNSSKHCRSGQLPLTAISCRPGTLVWCVDRRHVSAAAALARCIGRRLAIWLFQGSFSDLAVPPPDPNSSWWQTRSPSSN